MSLLVTVVIAYAAWCALLYLMQDSLVFPRAMIPVAPFAEPPRGVERIWIEPDGVRVEAWFVPGDGRDSRYPGPVVVFAHGNAELIDFNVELAEMYARWGVSTLLVEYRGYGRSGGSPSQDAIVRDFVAFYDILAQRPEVDPDRVVFHGRSLGGGVVMQLATHRTPRAVVLESTFTSVTAMARRYLAPPMIVRHPFRNDEVIRSLAAPVLLMHGDNDTIVAPRHSRRLAQLAPDARLVTFDAGHNDFPGDHAKYAEAIRALLDEAGMLDDAP